MSLVAAPLVELVLWKGRFLAAPADETVGKFRFADSFKGLAGFDAYGLVGLVAYGLL